MTAPQRAEAAARGLTSAEAQRRLDELGANELPRAPSLSWLVAARHQLTDPIMAVLLVAMALTLLIGDFTDMAVIGMVLVLNGVLGAVQEIRSARAVEALAELTAPRATVVRDGLRTDVPAREVVSGDLVLLAAGDIVPADAQLLQAEALQVDESMLTGESVPVDRGVGETVSAATVVRRGRGTAEVTRTGTATALGRIAGGLKDVTRVPTPLQRQLAGLGRLLAILVGVIAVIVVVINIVAGQGVEYSATIAISLAVAAIPESLPAVVTLSLALAARRMVDIGVLARRLAAVEALGSVTVLAADKTGTLTVGRMHIARLWTPSGTAPAERHLLEVGALCNDAAPDGTGPRDDPTEVALVLAAARAGIDVAGLRRSFRRVAEEPFDAELARMTTTHRAPGPGEQLVRLCKGSPEALETLGATDPAAPAAIARLSGSGSRLLAFAECGDAGWTLLGVAALADPPRPEAAEVIAGFRRAGVRPVMITGDHPATAASIATTVGIAHGPDDVVNGHSAGAHRTASVFARVRPEHKTAIVAALQDDGEVVAMTGDGVNDAPALRRADVGVAMGRRGTEVAKQAADLVLVEDDLSAMVRAIAEGRRAYDNVRRFLRYALSGGLTEVLVMLLGPALGLPVPLKPGQILWVNLLTHGLPGVAMGSEAAEPDVLARPPRPPQEPLVDRRLASGVAGYAVLMTVACFGAAAWAKQLERPWQSYLFVTLTLCQLALGLLLRPRWRRNELNPMLLGAVLVNVALIVAAVTWAPLRELLRTEPIGATDLLRCLAVTACFTAAAFVGRMLAHLPTLARADRARR